MVWKDMGGLTKMNVLFIVISYKDLTFYLTSDYWG